MVAHESQISMNKPISNWPTEQSPMYRGDQEASGTDGVML